MKKGWEKKDFEDCLEKVVYTRKVQRKDFLEAGKFPVISQEKEFINGFWDNSDVVFKITKPIIIFGDHTQVLKYVDFDFVLGADGVKILQPIDGIDTRFFFYFLTSVDLESLGYARHYRLLKDIQVPIPSLREQIRIVALLDEFFVAIDTAKANAEKNLANGSELFDSVLQGAFENKNWEKKKLEEICEVKDGTHDTPKYEIGRASCRERVSTLV
jgi:type I restriction enzyme, S subunit